MFLFIFQQPPDRPIIIHLLSTTHRRHQSKHRSIITTTTRSTAKVLLWLSVKFQSLICMFAPKRLSQHELQYRRGLQSIWQLLLQHEKVCLVQQRLLLLQQLRLGRCRFVQTNGAGVRCECCFRARWISVGFALQPH